MQIRHSGRDEMGVLIELHPEEGDDHNVLMQAGYLLKRNAAIAAHWRVENTYIVARVADPQWGVLPEQALELVKELFAQSEISINPE